jgi:hypothetical protein
MMMKATRTYGAAAATPIQDFSPQKISMTAHVNVLFQLK